MSVLHIFQVIWPIAVTIIPIVLGAGFLWLKTQFVTKADFEKRVTGDRDATDTAVRQIADRAHNLGDAILVLNEKVTNALEGPPARIDLLVKIAEVGQRVARVESSTESITKQLATQNDYLRALIDNEMRGQR